MIPVFATAPILPALLTCAAAWAIAVWALNQRDPVARVVQAITEPRDAGKTGHKRMHSDRQGMEDRQNEEDFSGRSHDGGRKLTLSRKS